MSWMILPVLACVVIVLTLGWFGLHVLQRGVIFVDLALAQVAALGTTYAVFLGHEPDSTVAFALSLVFTIIGAAAFSMARLYEERVPQEAIIGIAYAVSAAVGILMIHFADDPHGGEKLEHLLVGNIVWVQMGDLALLAGVCGAVGVIHAIFRERFLQISYRPEEAVAQGRNIALWDMLFYGSFGFALTAIVAVSGVLLVFSYLVIPAVIARLLVHGTVQRLVTAWAIGLLVSVAGVSVSYAHPTGPMIVGFFGVLLTIVLIVWAIGHAENKGGAIAKTAGAVAAIGAVLFGFGRITPAPEHHEEHEEVATVAPGDGLQSADPTAREAAVRDAAGKPERADALAAALAAETDDSMKLLIAVALARGGDRRGVEALVGLTKGEAPFVRSEADSRLRVLAGAAAPEYDPMAGPDAGAWSGWLAALAAVPESAKGLELP